MGKNILFQSVGFLLTAAFVSGCSTTFARQVDDQVVSFDSNVPDVEVNCSGKRTRTPGNIPLRQSKTHACMAELKGYEKQAFQIKSGISGGGFLHSTATNTAAWGWWTLGIGTGVGWLVDASSGAMKNLKEDSIYLEMKPIAPVGISDVRISVDGVTQERAIEPRHRAVATDAAQTPILAN